MRGLLWALVVCSVALSAPREIVYAPLPTHNHQAMLAQNAQWTQYLSEQLDHPVRMSFYTDYGDLITAYRSQEVDLALLGPLPYSQLVQKYSQAEAILVVHEPDGRAYYTCVVASAYDKIQNLEQLSAQGSFSLALTQPLSTCGDTMTFWTLQEAEAPLESAQKSYLGSHEAVALALVRGEFDVGGLKNTIADNYDGLGLRVLKQSAKLPGFALVANRATLSDERIEQIVQILLTSDEGVRQGWQLGRYGFSRPSGADYDLLDQAIKARE